MKNQFSSIDIMLLVMVCIWGVNFSVVKVTLSEIEPIVFATLRFLIGSTTLILALRLTEKNIRIRKRDLWDYIKLGIIGTTIYQPLFIIGINYTQASHSSLMLSTTPIFTALISTFLNYEQLNKKTWSAIFISFIGIFVIIQNGKWHIDFSSDTMIGDLISLGAAICWATYTVLCRDPLTRISSLRFAAYTSFIGTLFLLPPAVPFFIRQDWTAISLLGWAGLIYSALFAIALCYVLWNLGITKIGSTRTAIYSNLIPVVAISFAAIALSEIITIYQLIGASLIFAGIYLSRAGRKNG